jgi:NADH-quinone oxidoreductase subunit K
LGAVGVLIRRNALVMFMSVEMMLNSVNLTLITYSRFLGNVDGQVFVLLVMAVAAAEVAVGLAIIVAYYRHKQTTDVDEMNSLKW